MVLLGLMAVALAGQARDALDEGDVSWCEGRRADGVRRWRQAARLSRRLEDAEHASISISARSRLIQAGSNWTPLLRGGGLNRALETCPPDDPRCQQAFVDFHAFVPAWMGADPERALEGARYLQLDRPGPAAARLHLLEADDAPDLDLFTDLDGLGRCLKLGPFPHTGTSVVGLGVVADPAVGAGLGVRVVQPDGLRRRLMVVLDGFIAWQGGGGSLVLDPPQDTAWTLRASAVRSRWWVDADWTPVVQGSLMVGPRLRRKHLYADAGPVLRWDGEIGDDGVDAVPGHGLEGHFILDHRTTRERLLHGWRLSLSADGALAGIARYNRIAGVADLRLYQPLGPIEGAVRLRTEASSLHPDQPSLRTPAVGGPSVHRGAALGAHQGRWTATVDVEGRAPIWSVLWLAAFTDMAAVYHSDGTTSVHPGAGLGFRLKVPPVQHNTLRFDLGFDLNLDQPAYQVQVAWGEAI